MYLTTSKEKMEQKPSSPKQLHIIVFPFMSKGHTIPLLHLIKFIHIHRPHATFTVFTTPANEPFISACLSSLPPNNFTILSLPFSTNNNEIPLGVESTDQLPSMSLFHSFAFATEGLKPYFESAVENLQKVHNTINFLIADGFLYWIQESASKFNIPRLGFYGMNSYFPAISMAVAQNNVFYRVESEDELIQVPDFPWIKVRKDEFDSSFFINDPKDPKVDFVNKCITTTSMGYGMVVNNCTEIDQPFLDYLNTHSQPKSWCVGPLCLAEKPVLERSKKPDWIKWLDNKLDEGKHVLYVAFGSQAEITNEQLKEITTGLEKSGANFIWVARIKSNQNEVMNGFEERVKDKGLVVRSWVNQREILAHESVHGFLSHCGWNSATESICAGVPILTWPMMAEQHLNAKLLVEEIEVGLRVETSDGSPRGFVKWDGLSKMVKELMEGDMGKKVRKNVVKFSEVAKKCVEEGGSSWCNLECLLNELEIAHNTRNGYEGQTINGQTSISNNF